MQLDFPALGLNQKLIPQELDLLLHLCFGHLLHGFIAININKYQQCVAVGQRQLISAKCLE